MRNREKQRKYDREYKQRKYWEDPELARQKAREAYYKDLDVSRERQKKRRIKKNLADPPKPRPKAAMDRDSYARWYRTTPIGVLVAIYHCQALHSKKRGHAPPEYTRQELTDRYINDPLFLELHEKWIAGGKSRWDKPSLDRVNEAKGYSFDNIELKTWGENCRRQHSKQKIPVAVFKSGNLVGEFDSRKSAEKTLNIKIDSNDYQRLRTVGVKRSGYFVIDKEALNAI